MKKLGGPKLPSTKKRGRFRCPHSKKVGNNPPPKSGTKGREWDQLVLHGNNTEAKGVAAHVVAFSMHK